MVLVCGVSCFLHAIISYTSAEDETKSMALSLFYGPLPPPPSSSEETRERAAIPRSRLEAKRNSLDQRAEHADTMVVPTLTSTLWSWGLCAGPAWPHAKFLRGSAEEVAYCCICRVSFARRILVSLRQLFEPSRPLASRPSLRTSGYSFGLQAQRCSNEPRDCVSSRVEWSATKYRQKGAYDVKQGR